jgi:hypothetical protein
MERVSAGEAPTKVRRAAAVDDVTWCDGREMGKPYVTRTSICENQVIHALLFEPTTKELLGDAWYTVKQEINTSTSDVHFNEDFFLRVQAVTGGLIGGFNLQIEGKCVATSACQQGPGPWTGPAPVAAFVEEHDQKRHAHAGLQAHYYVPQPSPCSSGGRTRAARGKSAATIRWTSTQGV